MLSIYHIEIVWITIIFYKQLNSEVRAQLIKKIGRFEGSKLLSCCLISFAFIYDKEEKIILEKNSYIDVAAV